ncbi:MAG: hypothetical protein JRN20_14375 [Nitrososphaerota archaeon]|nr:hypothetical protein [Nitrososphaerota archaeon]MDG6921852.1 hypothetical protein [Nitrososphaerota archaeon]
MPRDFYDIRNLLRDGINISVSAKNYDYYELKKLAREAQESGASLRITDAEELESYEIRRISEEGGEMISFDFPEDEEDSN